MNKIQQTNIKILFKNKNNPNYKIFLGNKGDPLEHSHVYFQLC